MPFPPEGSLLDWLRFHLAYYGRPAAGDRLLDQFRRPFLPPADLPAPDAEAELERVRRGGAHVLLRGGAGWPENLRGLPRMPAVLFIRGEILPEDARAVAMVGSRLPSPHGLRQSERFAASLARAGVTVVSGLARGIDAAAHRGALSAGGRTIAVLGTGLGRIYPREHFGLAEEIARAGALVSELPWEAPPRQHHFPHRNRILSGLSLGVLVVEAGEKSGSLITAGWAADQGKDVMALPGRIDLPEARGGLRLIQDGAHLVIDPEDILLLAGLAPRSEPEISIADGHIDPAEATENAGEDLPHPLRALFAEEDAWHADRIIERLARPAGEVLAELSRLETAGKLLRLPGGAYARR